MDVIQFLKTKMNLSSTNVIITFTVMVKNVWIAILLQYIFIMRVVKVDGITKIKHLSVNLFNFPAN